MTTLRSGLTSTLRSKKTLSCCLGAVALAFSGCTIADSGVMIREQGGAKKIADSGSLPQAGLAFQLSPTDRVRVRVTSLQSDGSPEFETGDTVNYHFSLASKDYHVMVGDELAVNFGADPKLNIVMIVRPDGRITLANVAELNAAGKTPTELAAMIDQAYRDRLKEPLSSVNVSKSNLSVAELAGEATVDPDGMISIAKIGRFKAGGLTAPQLATALSELATGKFGNTLTAEVTRSPRNTTGVDNGRLIGYDAVNGIDSDGRILLPEIGFIDTTGKTAASLQNAIEGLVRERYRNPVGVQVVLESSDARVVYLDGEVARPGAYPVTAALTTLKAISLAGGVLDTGSLQQVVLIHRKPNQDLMVYVTNLKEFIEKAEVPNDLLVSPQDIVVVPKTNVAKVNLWIDQYINRNLPFSRNYSYNEGKTQVR